MHTSRLEVDLTILFSDGTHTKYKQSIRLYTVPELEHVLKGIGFTGIQVFGGLDLSTLDLGSQRLVLIAQAQKE